MEPHLSPPTRPVAPPRAPAAVTAPCAVVLADDRPLLGAALATALQADDLCVVARCDDLAALGPAVLGHRPDVLVLGNGLSRDCRHLLPGLRSSVPGLATLVVAEAVGEASRAYLSGNVDAVMGPEGGIDHLRRAVHRARAGERFLAGLVGPGPAGGTGRGIELTDREEQVLLLLATGASNEAIASSLHISVNTVRGHVAAILRKLGRTRRLAAVRRAWELGLLDRLTA